MAKKTQLETDELREILRNEREMLFTGTASTWGSDDKWEQAWDSTKMVNLTPARLKTFPHPIPLKGLDVLAVKRIQSRILDYIFVAVPLIAVDAMVHLLKLARMIFGDLGIQENQYQYGVVLDPVGRELALSNFGVLSKLFFIGILFLLLYRLFFYVFFKRTLGQMFSDTMITNSEGRFPGFFACLIKAVTTTLGDAALIGGVLDLGAYVMTKPQVSFSDAIAGMRAVRFDDWRGLAARLMTRLHNLRREGAL